MQKAETILSIIQKYGRERRPLERVYRLFYNPELYRLAYARIYSNDGALTKGSDDVTLDGMSEKRIAKIIEALRCERWRWTPVRRTHIPKSGKKGTRPLGIPSGDDKLFQEVIRMLLEAYFEPQFSEYSHGFRPGRGCHTALHELSYKHKGTKWFIEGDISKCFDSFDHEVLLRLLRKNIHDERFLNLINRLLKAGYIEDWKWNRTQSGAPQGGIVSPLLSNIYLHEFDEYVANVLMPQYNKGTFRDRHNIVYGRFGWHRQQARKKKDWKKYKEIKKMIRQTPSLIDSDKYRRLKYLRYADDFILSFAGPKEEAELIKMRIAKFLHHTLCLELSEEKTLITHARSETARFLGYDVNAMWSDTKQSGKAKVRSVNGAIALRIPKDKVKTLCQRYMRNGKAIHRPELVMRSDYDIISIYQAEYRGYVQYYALAYNVCDLHQLRWVMETSLLKTLANKYKSTVNKMVKKYKTTMETADGQRKCIRVEIPREGKKSLVATFGGIPLKRKKRVDSIKDKFVTVGMSHSEILQRLQADSCEMCGSKGNVEIHHIRKLADLKKPGRKSKPMWVQRMSAIRRKTLVVCPNCHDAIHAGRHKPEWDVWKSKLESRMM